MTTIKSKEYCAKNLKLRKVADKIFVLLKRLSIKESKEILWAVQDEVELNSYIK